MVSFEISRTGTLVRKHSKLKNKKLFVYNLVLLVNDFEKYMHRKTYKGEKR